MSALTAEPPLWPSPTQGVSEIRLELRYRPRGRVARTLSDTATLYLELVDYPGEWLLDLPLLDLDYTGWSEEVRQQLEGDPELKSAASEWLSLGEQLRGAESLDENQLTAVVQAYTDYLHHCRSVLGHQLVQPGRFILPGEYAGAPVLQFIPWLWEIPSDPRREGSLYRLLEERFEHYKQHIVKGFYRQHFSQIDRQIILVDCLAPLNHGMTHCLELQRALAQIMKSFAYGKSNWWRRLFAPRIDRVLFAATKADHITPDQHANLVSLLQHLVRQGYQQAQFEGIKMECMALASIQATEPGMQREQGEAIPALKGRRLEDGKQVILYPGEVPAEFPPASFWEQQGFSFNEFAPPERVINQCMQHIRLDAALQFLVGDKLR
ncbi:YcjX family GTP-binding protein [Dongshaea marina]|uniref:YcjX family protein n=1 Tax=Dongshaea marina TaxID=2047966 RepID=UPI0022792020|nr:YcjX family protein [Dongshaea marina]